jgi:hypothetical protein
MPCVGGNRCARGTGRGGTEKLWLDARHLSHSPPVHCARPHGCLGSHVLPRLVPASSEPTAGKLFSDASTVHPQGVKRLFSVNLFPPGLSGVPAPRTKPVQPGTRFVRLYGCMDELLSENSKPERAGQSFKKQSHHETCQIHEQTNCSRYFEEVKHFGA